MFWQRRMKVVSWYELCQNTIKKNILGTYYLRIWGEILIKDGLRTKSMKMVLDKLQDVPR